MECASLVLQQAPSLVQVSPRAAPVAHSHLLLLQFQDKDGIAPLHLASQAGNTELIELLIAKFGASLNSRDNEQHTAVHWAVAKEQLEVSVACRGARNRALHFLSSCRQ